MIKQASNAFLFVDKGKPVSFQVSVKDDDKWRMLTFEIGSGHFTCDGMKTEVVYATGPQSIPIKKLPHKVTWWDRLKAKIK